ncbi:inositol-trisphosphate 3-kinase homolog isoform X3 [Neodiprion virginianus]|uniref:inositol-trisphosphate 3-kinase homolog isoform X3 n=1 Tax=Neodiprion fabricii TaxID=2872261 RepID=UPI001ED9344B|nr:inositol-trisphosphate 3-kinase homolog isoform X3 [Neodiprion fabricii]XP_046619389.1 inositol-trisphosphate 3-kinase homolog isoform X3 [Neodiprion virginianus]
MSSSVCHAPLPARMEAFTTRLCLRAVDQYERLLQAHFNKPSSKEQPSRLRHESASPKEQRRRKENPGSYSAVTAFRQWRRSTSVGSRSGSANSKLPNDPATNALDLTAPASDVLLKNRLKSWFQLSGHPDGFAPAGPGTVWKRRTGGAENTERMVYEALSKDETMRDCVPRYYREVEYKGDTFIELQDLLFGFNDPHVMDIKMGTRTFLESEVSKTAARPDLYQKMVAVDPDAPTIQEHEQRAVTKLRYMQFREQQSSTCSHGFRIEAMKLPGAPPITDLKRVKSHSEVLGTMAMFLKGRGNTREKLLERLRNLRVKFQQSTYFQTHEVIGSSIFMIYDEDKVGVWLIDFAKTYRVSDGQILTHRSGWEQGNHEEGFLFGLDNLISTIEEVDISS